MILIATKNEEATIGALLGQLRNFNVVMIDDSTDNTREIASRFRNVSIIEGDNQGIWAAYRKGFELAISRDVGYVLQMDAGLTHDPSDIERFWEVDAELVSGARRFSYKGYRTIISYVAARLFGVPDATCGYRMWNVNLLRRMDFGKVKSKGFAFQIELLLQAMKLTEVKFVPIEYKLTNSSFKLWMLSEAIAVYLKERLFK